MRLLLSRVKESDAALGAIAAIVCTLLVAGALSGTITGIFSGGSSRTVKAVFVDTRQLEVGNPVRIDGVDVGTVTALQLDPGGQTATVALALDSSAGPLYRDASASIRFRTLLGGAFYVQLDRGTPGVGDLGAGDAIPASRTTSQVELDDITTVVRGAAKRGLQTMPGELAKVLRDPREPAGALQAVATQSPSLASGLSAVQGSDPSTDIGDLITSANRTMGAFDAPTGQLQRLVAGTASLVEVTSARSSDISNTIDRAPGVMDRTNTTLTQLSRTLSIANPLLSTLDTSAPRVAPTVSRLRGTIEPANTLAQSATPLLYSLRPAVQSLASASQEALPLLNSLAPSISELQDKILPYTAKPDSGTQRSTAEMIGPAAEALGSIGSYVDDSGRFVRFPATSGNTPLYLPCQTYFSNPDDVNKVVACQSIKSALQMYFGDIPGGAKP
jgi:virulence factor Mce-like protein